MLARVLPRLGGAAAGGELADRFRPQRVAAGLVSVQALLMWSIIPAAQHHAVWAIYVAVALSQLLGGAVQPSLMAMVPRLVPAARRARANALLNVAFSSSIVVAPALSVPLLRVMDPPRLIALDVVSFAVAGLLLLSLRIGGGRAEVPPPAFRGALAGIRVVWNDGHLRALAGVYLGAALAVTTAGAVLVVAAADRLGGAGQVGALYAGVGTGSILGGLFALRHAPSRVRPSTFVAGGICEIVLLACLTLATRLPAAVVLLAASSGLGAPYEVWGATELQRRARPELLGRASAAVVGAQYAGMILGAVAAVILVPLLGWDRALFAACCLGVGVIAASISGPLAESPEAPSSEAERVVGVAAGGGDPDHGL